MASSSVKLRYWRNACAMVMEHVDPHFKCGFVAIVGRPNVGKSTLMNAIVGANISIATAKPQTTRNRIVGVRTWPGKGQIAFVDTPGIHDSSRRLNQRMTQAAYDSLEGTDVICLVTEATSLTGDSRPPLWGIDGDIADRIAASGKPAVLIINKIDEMKNREQLLPLLSRLHDEKRFGAIIPISARRGNNVDHLVDVILSLLPERPPIFEADVLTDRAERFVAAELVREQVLLKTHEEVPYGVAVEIESFADSAVDGKLRIAAVIHVERDSQKGIIIGRGGAKLKEIGTAARIELQKFFARPIDLKTTVRVEPGWSDSEKALDRLGYRSDEI
jgi:GTP-binding protein Era